ncbi:GntR family transcriptional regulator [Variovorax ginsengisoli]|uniref:GntR family transcriptional regulator n=1 Tax=Variovorax ginsengisoli TaxID=363844 RepID=A0ABT8SG20_9BURK|nr:GntR family transcriptional regulator [Variovorax ginsengisoli]MDN8617762.1 GntR family transcriptional regulator [Variovorax ginsengisoli]MDO1536932.1 GntR family transcriptional regulator [Variovorax ginsengisoli]
MKLSERLFDELERAIRNGVLRAGEHLPSIREACRTRQLSVTTVSRASLQLESRDLIESQPQSGYFVRALHVEPSSDPIAVSQPPDTSTDVDTSRLLLTTINSIRTGSAVPLGSPYPDPTLLPWQRVHQQISAFARRLRDARAVLDDQPPGHPELIRLSTPTLPQLGVAEYLKNDGFKHHLRRVRQTLAQQARIMISMARRFFPEHSRLSRPEGGCVLWVELAPHVGTMALYREALERGWSIGADRMFSTSNTYGHFMRLNYSYPWSPEIEAAVIELGRIAAAMTVRSAR